jgi:hypothetical protein
MPRSSRIGGRLDHSSYVNSGRVPQCAACDIEGAQVHPVGVLAKSGSTCSRNQPAPVRETSQHLFAKSGAGVHQDAGPSRVCGWRVWVPRPSWDGLYRAASCIASGDRVPRCAAPHWERRRGGEERSGPGSEPSSGEVGLQPRWCVPEPTWPPPSHFDRMFETVASWYGGRNGSW